MMLPDGTIVPSFLGVQERGEPTFGEDIFQDIGLRVGEIKKVTYPDNPMSHGGRVAEYEILCTHRDGGGITHTHTYRGVQASTLFGSKADRFGATFRTDASEEPGVGARVLFMCINGNQQQAVIIGALEPAGTRTDQNLGHNLFFEFNGVRFEINKDGEPTLTFGGATKTDGTLVDGQDSEASGATVRIDKTGKVTLATANQSHYISLDRAQNQVVVKTDGNVEVEATGNVNIGSAGTIIGAGTDQMLLASTYRTQEAAMHQALAAALGSVAASLSGAAASLATAAAGITASATAPGLIALLNAAPVPAGNAYVAAGPAVTAAAGTIAGAAGALVTAQTQILTMEALAPTFLSTKNRND